MADLHGRPEAIRALQEAVREHGPDVIVLPGDMTTHGSKAQVRQILDSLPGEVLAIPGNMDGPATLEAIRESHIREFATGVVKVSGVRLSGQPKRGPMRRPRDPRTPQWGPGRYQRRVGARCSLAVMTLALALMAASPAVAASEPDPALAECLRAAEGELGRRAARAEPLPPCRGLALTVVEDFLGHPLGKGASSIYEAYLEVFRREGDLVAERPDGQCGSDRAASRRTRPIRRCAQNEGGWVRFRRMAIR